jgi:MFS family permease
MTENRYAKPPEPQAPLPVDTPTYEADVSSPPRRVLRGLRTFESFQHRDYSYFFAGALLSNIGTWTQTVALGWVIYALTKSSSSLGVVNFLSGIPIFFLTLLAGSLVDHMDRRTLLIWAQVIMMGQAVAFALLNHTGHITIGWIYLLTLAGGVVSAFMFPAWQAMVPDLVPRSSLLNAVALSSAQFNAARLVGPMVTAAIMAVFAANENLGITMVFTFNAVSFLFVIWALTVIRPNQEVQGRSGESARRMLGAGLAYARDNTHVAVHLVTATMLVIFGMPFMTLLPAIAVDTLGLGSAGYSSLMMFNGLGALAGALAVASLPRTVRRERIIRLGLAIMAVGSIALGLSHSYVLSSILLVVLGAAFLACVSSINTNLQTAAPNHLRGRIMALFVIAFMGMMPFGSLAFGALGDVIGSGYAVLAGGVALSGWALFLHFKPRLLCPGNVPGC